MEFNPRKYSSPAAMAFIIYFVLFASATAAVSTEMDQDLPARPEEGTYVLGSWTHEPMFVDEPRWILSWSRNGQSSEDDDDDRFWVTRGKKRRNTSRIPSAPHSSFLLGRRSDPILEELHHGSWTDRGEKGSLSNLLGNDPFWVNRGRRGSVSSALDNSFYVNRGRRGDVSNALNKDTFWVNRGKRGSVSSALDQDPFYVNRGRRGDISSTFDQEQFSINRGKRGSVSSALEQDPFYVSRGKGGDISSVFEHDPFWVNRGKRDSVSSVLDPLYVKGGQRDDVSSDLDKDPFWVNRGRRGSVSSALQQDSFYVNRGRRGDVSSVLDKDPFWVNRGKKYTGGEDASLSKIGLKDDSNEDDIAKRNGIGDILSTDPYWANRGKKNEVTSTLEGSPQYWVNRAMKNELRPVLTDGEQFWVNRGKKDELRSVLKSGDQFWVKRGKRSAELQSLLNTKDQFWVNRGKKNPELQSLLNSGDRFWVNRGKKNPEIQPLLGSGDQFWVNTEKKHVQTLLKNGDQFWVNRGKKNPTLQSLLGKEDQFWVNRGKKSDVQYLLNSGEQFWVNRDKKESSYSINGVGNRDNNFSSNSNKITNPAKSEELSLLNKSLIPDSLFWSNSLWDDRLKKEPLQTILKQDPFWIHRGIKSSTPLLYKQKLNEKHQKIHGNTKGKPRTKRNVDEKLKQEPFWDDNRKEQGALIQYPFWIERGIKTNGVTSLEPFWVARGKRPEFNRKRQDVRDSMTSPEITTKSTTENMKLLNVMRERRLVTSPSEVNSGDDRFTEDDLNSLMWQSGGSSEHGHDEGSPNVPHVILKYPTFQRLGDNIFSKQEPFWVNRGKRSSVVIGEFAEEVPPEILPEKFHENRNSIHRPLLFSESSLDFIDNGGLPTTGETFWVTRG